MLPNGSQPEPSLAKTQEKDIFSLLFECAIESFVEAVMALIWGKIIFGVVGGIAGQMVPSPPPGMSSAASSRHHPASPAGSWFASDTHQAWIVFALFFAFNLRARMRAPIPGDVNKKGCFDGAVRRLREEGFSILFKNAIGAMIGALVASWASNWSWSQMCLRWLGDAVTPTLNRWAIQFFGQGHVGAAHDWWNWWSDNQLKFTFWVLYIAAICDDLGLPNFKTLARFFWRRWRRNSPRASVGLVENPSD